MGHVTLLEEALMGKSPLCMFGVHLFSGIGDKTYDRKTYEHIYVTP